MVKFSVSGLRGVVGAQLSCLDFMQTANSYTRFMKASKTLVARDARLTGNMIAGAVKAGVLAAGAKVVDAGMVTTPTAVFATRESSSDSGLVVTASHNPAQENGLKFLEQGRFLPPRKTDEFISFSKSGEFYQIDAEKVSSVEEFDAISSHCESVVKLMAGERSEPSLKVGLDPVNGAAGPEALRILEKMGCEVYTVNQEPHGRFGRGTEPVPENLTELKSLVADKGLDIGFAFDPDGDRLAFVDERGRAPGEEYTVPLCARWVLEKKGGDVVVNLSTSRLIDYVASEKGFTVHRTPVGEAHVVDRMGKTSASCGGEGNGGFILPDFNATRDGLLAMAILVALRRKEGSLADLVDALPGLYRRKAKFKIPWSERLARTTADLFPRARTDTSDGLWISEEDFWLHLRPSNTEPVVRLMLEANSEARAENILKEVEKKCVE